METIMYDHIGLRVADLDASTRFYTAVLAPLGYILCSSGEGYAGFGPKGEPALWLHLNKGRKADGAHIAFRAGDHDAVKKFHSEGLKDRRSRQWRRRSAQGLQPDLLRGVFDRS
jgi:catechol 2,3-dioxygenase-like lactoylglutathione lyase family enzyme